MKMNKAIFEVTFLLVTPIFLFSQFKYIHLYRPLADSLAAVYEIPASVILGVAIVESGAGSTKNATILNNHFGIIGKNNLHQSRGIKTRYKQFITVKDSYIAFCKLVSKRKFYKTLKGNNNYLLWVNAISKTGYSELPEVWRRKIITIIKKNRLARNERS